MFLSAQFSFYPEFPANLLFALFILFQSVWYLLLDSPHTPFSFSFFFALFIVAPCPPTLFFSHEVSCLRIKNYILIYRSPHSYPFLFRALSSSPSIFSVVPRRRLPRPFPSTLLIFLPFLEESTSYYSQLLLKCLFFLCSFSPILPPHSALKWFNFCPPPPHPFFLTVLCILLPHFVMYDGNTPPFLYMAIPFSHQPLFLWVFYIIGAWLFAACFRYHLTPQPISLGRDVQCFLYWFSATLFS